MREAGDAAQALPLFEKTNPAGRKGLQTKFHRVQRLRRARRLRPAGAERKQLHLIHCVNQSVKVVSLKGYTEIIRKRKAQLALRQRSLIIRDSQRTLGKIESRSVLSGVKKPRVLLTNDDGYQAEGLRALKEELKDYDVQIVAPSWERSGAAQSLTLRQPIVCHRVAQNEWAIDGTPADCVIVALHRLLNEKPDVVISGINHGANLGENVYYSGTVGAAREAAIHHVPGLAISLCSKRVNSDFAPSAHLARQTVELILKEKLPDQVVLNINVPESWRGGVRFTRQSKKITRTVLREGEDPRGRPYFWLSEQRIDRDMELDAESDYAAIFAGEVSVTPLHLDPTHTESLNHLSHWAEQLRKK
jgi:5'-nucleotidase